MADVCQYGSASVLALRARGGKLCLQVGAYRGVQLRLAEFAGQLGDNLAALVQHQGERQHPT